MKGKTIAKKASLLLAAVMIGSAVCIPGASASDDYDFSAKIAKATADGQFSGIGINSSDVFTVKYNGEAVTFPDAQPFVDANSRTMIPLRAVAETMGAEVSWDDAAQTAVIAQNGVTVTVPVGSDTITVTENGIDNMVRMDTQAVLAVGRTYVPIRYVAEALGAYVGYSDLFSTVQIYRDVLTPTEISRLRSYYDAGLDEYLESIGKYKDSLMNDEVMELMYPAMKNFVGIYGFENANEWKLRNPNGIEQLTFGDKTSKSLMVSYTGVTSGKTFSYGKQPDLDFAKLVLAEARGVEDEINAAGKVKISLRSDLSCVYASRHANGAGTYVRGVLTVTIPSNADIAWIKKNYDFISDPKAGETRDVDVQILVNTFSADVHWSEMTALE